MKRFAQGRAAPASSRSFVPRATVAALGGALWTDEDAKPLDPACRTKLREPVFRTCYDHGIHGPGHKRFTCAEDEDTVMLAYHARTCTGIAGAPLWNPDRHACVKPLRRGRGGAGMPVCGRPSTY